MDADQPGGEERETNQSNAYQEDGMIKVIPLNLI